MLETRRQNIGPAQVPTVRAYILLSLGGPLNPKKGWSVVAQTAIPQVVLRVLGPPVFVLALGQLAPRTRLRDTVSTGNRHNLLD